MPAPTEPSRPNRFDRYFTAKERQAQRVTRGKRRQLNKRLHTMGAAKARERTEAEQPRSENVMSMGALEQEVRRKKGGKKHKPKGARGGGGGSGY